MRKSRTEIFEELLRYWRNNAVPYLPGVRESEIALFEQRYSVRTADDFRQFYLRTDGTFVPGATGCDAQGFAFWRLRDVRRDSESGVFIFADFMDESWWYAVDLSPAEHEQPGAVSLFGGPPFRPVTIASSVSDFVSLYLSNDKRLYFSREVM